LQKKTGEFLTLLSHVLRSISRLVFRAEGVDKGEGRRVVRLEVEEEENIFENLRIIEQ